MVAVQLLGLIAGLACMSAAFEARAQAPLRGGPPPATTPSVERERPERDDDRPRERRRTIEQPSAPLSKPKPPASSTYTAPPRTRERTERDYDPRPAPRPSVSPKSTSAPKTQAVRSTVAPPPRDPALARCDEFRRRMEQVMREEMRGGDPVRMQRLAEERKRIYQEELRAGC